MKKFIISIVRYSGLPFLLRFVNQKQKITVLLYHDVRPEIFKRQIKFLSKYYNFISVENLLDYLNSKTCKLPAYPVLITFDDGHAGNFNLLDLFEEYKCKPVIFLVTSVAGTRKPFWFKLPDLRPDEKERLKNIPDSERVEYLKKHYSEKIQSEYQHALRWEDVMKMNEIVDFHSHTHNHPCLPECSTETIYSELTVSRTEIEKQLKSICFAIAYPNGDFNKEVIGISNKTGYNLGFTIKPGYVSKSTDKLEIPRLSTNDTSDLNEFILRITGTWFLMKIFTGLFRKNK